MAALQTLYNNIKKLITKYFEEKTIEDKTLPQCVELYFNYNQGELNINDTPNTQNTLKFIFKGTTLSQHSDGSFNGSNMFIDYGDGTIEKTTGKFGHTYEENKTYKVRIYGITGLVSCFRNCTGLTSIILPDSVTNLGNYCFYNCTGLTSITLSDNVTNLRDYCFHNCTNLTSITLPDSITSLGSACFDICTGLTSIILPDSVISLGGACFYGCTGLTSINIPSSVTSIGYQCFYGCTGLTEIILQWDSSSEIISYNSTWINGCTLFDHFLIPEDTTQLYIDAGYPSELLKEEKNTPTVDSVSLISDKSILSYANSESAILSATVLDSSSNPIENVIVEFFKGSTSLGTATTNSSGIATKTYSSSASGKISFTATIGSLTSEPCQVIDAKYYASDSLISSAPTYNNDRTLFASDYTVQIGDIIHFKFKSLSNRMLVGIGSTQGSDFTFEKDGTTLKYWRNVLTNGSYNNPSFMFSTEHETVMEFTQYSSSEYKINLYNDDVYVDYWRCGHSISKIRVDKFFNNNCEIEVYVL